MPAQEAFRIKKRIEGVGEKTRVAGNSAKYKAILVLDLSLYDAVAEGQVLFGRRDSRSPFSGRSKASAGHRQGSEHFACAEVFQPLSGKDFERLAQQNESGIGVLSAASGRRFDGQAEAGVEQRLAPVALLEEPDVAGQTRSVGE